MQNTNLLILILLLSLHTVFAQENKKNTLDFPALKERYMGQKLPDLVALPFAPGRVATEKYLESGLEFLPNMSELIFTRMGGKYKKPTLIVLAYKNNQWRRKTILPAERKAYREQFVPPMSEIKSFDVFKDLPITGFTKSSKGTYYFYHIEMETGNGHMSYSRLIDGTYEKPIKMSKAINTGKYIAHPYIAPDESYLMWDAEMEGENTPDIYISFRKKDGSWGQGINLGASINTPSYEQYGRVTPDGKYLYFWKGDVKTRKDGSRYVVGSPYWIDAKIIETLRPKE